MMGNCQVRFLGEGCRATCHLLPDQGDYETHLAQRLFEYFYRLYDRYRLPIITMAILTDDSPTWRPDRYQINACDLSILDFQFFPKKLLDYQGQEPELLEMDNPFGTVVVAHLSALATSPDPEARYQHKFSLTRRLRNGHDTRRDPASVLFHRWYIDAA